METEKDGWLFSVCGILESDAEWRTGGNKIKGRR